MKSNKIFLTISLLVCLVASLMFSSCEEEDKSYSEADSLHFATDTTNVSEAETSYTPIRIVFLKTSAISASATVTITGGVEGVDYELQDPNLNFTFGPNDFADTINIRPINNNVLTGSTVITLSLSSPDVAVGFPGPDALNSTHGFVIEDDDCASPLAGSYNITASSGCFGDGAGACGATTFDTGFPWAAGYTVSMALTACDGDGKYIVDDITCGMYPEGYGDSPNPNPGTIIVTGSAISIIEAESPDVIYGGDAFFGDGTANSDGTVLLNFANSYGDAGSVTLAPQ